MQRREDGRALSPDGAEGTPQPHLQTGRLCLCLRLCLWLTGDETCAWTLDVQTQTSTEHPVGVTGVVVLSRGGT